MTFSTEEAKDCRTLCNIRPRYKPSKCFVNFKNNTISIKYDDGSFMEHEGVLYESGRNHNSHSIFTF